MGISADKKKWLFRALVVVLVLYVGYAGYVVWAMRQPPEEFARVSIDPEVRTLVWPSGADFDPTILHDWPEHEPAFKKAAARWEDVSANTSTH